MTLIFFYLININTFRNSLLYNVVATWAKIKSSEKFLCTFRYQI
jgi:hypothetical protein